MTDTLDWIKKAVVKWFNSIPKKELDKPIIGDYGVYTTRQLHDTMLELLELDSDEERTKRMKELPDILKDLLLEVIIQYGDEK